MAQLPSNRTRLQAAISDQSQSITPASGQKNREALLEAYDTIDLLNQKLDSYVSAGALAPYPPNFLSRQAVINGNFDVWQRGTSFDVTSSNYTADRWKLTSGGANYNASLQSISDLVGSNYCMRITFKAAGANDAYFSQGFESDTFKKLKGKKITVSFYARKSGTPLIFVASLRYTASESNVHNGTLIGTSLNLSTTLTSGWVKYSLTVDMPPITDTNQGLQLVLQAPSTNVNEYIELAQVQVNAGDQALPFQPRSFAEELALCMRYYHSSWDSGLSPSIGSISVYAIATNLVSGTYRFPVVMRATPTISVKNNNVTNQVRKALDGTVVTISITSFIGGNAKGFSGMSLASAVLTAAQTYDFDLEANAEL